MWTLCGFVKGGFEDGPLSFFIWNFGGWHYDKIGVLQLGLQLGFSCCFELQWPFTTLTNFYNLSVVKQVAIVATTQFKYMKLYTYITCATMLQLLCQCDDMAMMWWHIINGHMEILNLFQYIIFLLI